MRSARSAAWQFAEIDSQRGSPAPTAAPLAVAASAPCARCATKTSGARMMRRCGGRTSSRRAPKTHAAHDFVGCLCL